MIKLAFVGPNRKILKFEIENKVVRYFDEIWKSGVQIYPKHEPTIKRLINSRSGNLKVLAALILDANKGKQLEEYKSCKTDEEIAEFIKRDCKSKGLLEAKK